MDSLLLKIFFPRHTSRSESEEAIDIAARLRAYWHRLDLPGEPRVPNRAGEKPVSLEIALTELRADLAKDYSGDFLAYRLANHFGAREEDFQCPPLSRQPLSVALFEAHWLPGQS
jgi:hypothetical protein